MSFVYTAISPDGQVHRALERHAFVAILRDLRAQFPDDFITVRADARDVNIVSNDLELAALGRGGAA